MTHEVAVFGCKVGFDHGEGGGEFVAQPIEQPVGQGLAVSVQCLGAGRVHLGVVQEVDHVAEQPVGRGFTTRRRPPIT